MFKSKGWLFKSVFIFTSFIYCQFIYATDSTASFMSTKLSSRKLSDSTFIINSEKSDTNIGLLKTQSGVVLIDPVTGVENLNELNAFIQKNFPALPVYLLNTHNHSDHTGGNQYFIERESKLLNTDESSDVFAVTVKSHSSSDNIYFHIESNAIFVGDIYDTSWHPTFYAGGMSGFNEAIEQILKTGNEESLIVPGHGVPTSKAQLRQFQKNTIEWVKQVNDLNNKDFTVEQIKNDLQILRLLERFNLQGKANFLPEKAITRFIERTLSVIKTDKE